MKYGVKIIGLGSAVPEKIVSNTDLESILDTNSEWIETRTGIKERRICDSLKGENGLSLATTAAKKALGKFPAMDGLDLIIVATSTPDFLYPATACRLQKNLNAINAVGFDISAACSGFIFALINACQFIQSGIYKNALVVGVDIHSRVLDWSDRSVSILFGDGAGAVLLEQTSLESNQLLSFSMKSDGNSCDELTLPCTVSEYPSGKNSKIIETVKMNGRKIYAFAIKTIPESILEVSKSINLSVDEIDYLICHQANQRILDSIAEKLGWSEGKCLSNISKYGNTSAASIPLALDEFKQIFNRNNILCLSGFGAGLTWGSILWKWENIL